MTAQDQTKRHLLLVGEAIRKGFRVCEDEDGVWIVQPARPRRPAILLGSYPNYDRAWMGAAFLAQNFPEA